MSIARKWFAALVLLAAAVAAMPASADFKALTILTPTAPNAVVGTAKPLVVYFKNVGDNSSFNSIELEVATISGGTIAITNAQASPGKKGTFSSLSATKFRLTDLSPVKVGDAVTVTLTVNLTAACGGTTITWKGDGWTGSPSEPSNHFTPVLPNGTTSTGAQNCLITITNPANALVNQVITGTEYDPTGAKLQATVTKDGVAQSGVAVTLTSSCTSNALTLTDNAATTTGGTAQFPLLKSSTAASGCTLKATAAGYPDSAPSSTFAVRAPQLTLSNQPATALSGAVITSTPFNTPSGNFVTAKLTLDGANAAGFSIAMTSTCTGLTGTPETTDANGNAIFDALKINDGDGATACTVTASAFNGSVTSTPSSAFNVAGIDGTLNCGQTIPPADTNPGNKGPNEPGYASSTRGEFNSNGQDCVPVSYNFTNLVLSDGEAELKWDTASQSAATFLNTVNWEARLSPTDGSYPVLRRPKVAWEFDANGDPIPSKVTDGLACLSAKMPKPYGRVPAGGLTASDTSFTLDTSIAATPPGWEVVPPTPFPIYVDNERMTVTAVSGSSWTVLRAQAGTGPAVAHSGGRYVMSTPMPVDPRADSPYFEKAVRMCIVMHGFQAYTPDPDTGAARHFEFTDYIDGDGWINTER